jgi:hypothetical protein
METTTPAAPLRLSTAEMSRTDLRQVLGDYLALEHLRTFRRRALLRLGCILVALLALDAFNLVPRQALLISAAILAVVSALLWGAERRARRRLLEAPPVVKVIKSS